MTLKQSYKLHILLQDLKGWDQDKTLAHWNKRMGTDDWPKGWDDECNEVSCFVPGEEYIDSQRSAAHSCEITMGNKEVKGAKDKDLKAVVAGLQNGPPGVDMPKELFDGESAINKALKGGQVFDMRNMETPAIEFNFKDALLSQVDKAKRNADGPAKAESASGSAGAGEKAKPSGANAQDPDGDTVADGEDEEEPFNVEIELGSTRAEQSLQVQGLLQEAVDQMASCQEVLDEIAGVGESQYENVLPNMQVRLAALREWDTIGWGNYVGRVQAKELKAPMSVDKLVLLKSGPELVALANTFGADASTKDQLAAASMAIDGHLSLVRIFLADVDRSSACVKSYHGQVVRNATALKKRKDKAKDKEVAAREAKAEQANPNQAKVPEALCNVFRANLTELGHPSLVSVPKADHDGEVADTPYTISDLTETASELTSNQEFRLGLLVFKASAAKDSRYKEHGICMEEMHSELGLLVREKLLAGPNICLPINTFVFVSMVD